MDSIIIIITALIFYVLGRYSGREAEVWKEAIKQSKILNRTKPGVIDYADPKQIEYVGSEQEKIDQDQERLIKEKLRL